MKRSKTQNIETVRIENFFEQQGEIEIDQANLLVPLGTGPFAQAAMLKGFMEFFLKPMGAYESFPQDIKTQVQENLAKLQELTDTAQARSKIIL